MKKLKNRGYSIEKKEVISKLLYATKELIVSMLEDWGLNEKYKAIKRAEAAIAETEQQIIKK